MSLLSHKVCSYIDNTIQHINVCLHARLYVDGERSHFAGSERRLPY